MIQIRFNTFETNSSSTHSLIMSNSYFGDITDITIDWNLKIGYKRVQELNTPSDKALYFIMSLLDVYYDDNRDEIDSLHRKLDPQYYDVDCYEDTTNTLLPLIVSECYRVSTEFRVLIQLLKPQSQIDDFIEEIKLNYNSSNFEQDLSGYVIEGWFNEYNYLRLSEFYKSVIFGDNMIVCNGDC